MAKVVEKEKLQVNVDFTEFPELYKGLEKVVAEEMTDRSKYIRKLVAQDIARRQQLELGLEIPSALPSSKGKGNLSQKRQPTLVA